VVADRQQYPSLSKPPLTKGLGSGLLLLLHTLFTTVTIILIVFLTLAGLLLRILVLALRALNSLTQRINDPFGQCIYCGNKIVVVTGLLRWWLLLRCWWSGHPLGWFCIPLWWASSTRLPSLLRHQHPFAWYTTQLSTGCPELSTGYPHTDGGRNDHGELEGSGSAVRRQPAGTALPGEIIIPQDHARVELLFPPLGEAATMDTRKLRKMAPTSFAAAQEKATPLRTAADDGFEFVEGDDRATLAGLPMVLMAWDLRPAFRANSGELATVYAYVPNEDGTPRPIKFIAGGGGMLSIPTILRNMLDNGITSNVAVTMTAEKYEFYDEESDTTIPAIRYGFEDLGEGSPDY
jgi:hypothetical protein